MRELPTGTVIFLFYLHAMRQSQSVGAKRITAFCVAGLAAVAAARGQQREAAFLWGAVERFEQATRTPLLAADRAKYDEVMRPALEGWPSDLERGRWLELDDAVAQALGTLTGI
jgi:hypothetical protein